MPGDPTPSGIHAKCFINRFKVDLCDHITKVSPVTFMIEKCGPGDGRMVNVMAWKPGQPKYQNMTFTFAEHKDSIGNLKQWVKAVYDGKEVRKDISLDVFDQEGNSVRHFDFKECYPVRFHLLDATAGVGGGVTQGEIEVKVGYVEIQA